MAGVIFVIFARVNAIAGAHESPESLMRRDDLDPEREFLARWDARGGVPG
jgi:hypothetical protein